MRRGLRSLLTSVLVFALLALTISVSATSGGSVVSGWRYSHSPTTLSRIQRATLREVLAPDPAPEFTRLVSITGGGAQRLSTSLSDAGYTGTASVDELTFCTPSANVNTMYLGSQSNVSASNGFPMEPGSCITYRAGARPVDVSSFYVYVATTENAAVTLRPR